jgi:peptidoglycan/LPS O-acetylase OafA/YrhL
MAAQGSPTLEANAAIDGLRGVAALIVVASHASLLGSHLVPGFSLAGTGKYGVFLFFVISAFLLTAQWLAADARQRPLGFLARYLVKRFARIYPLYALVLAVGWALAPRGLGVPLDGEAVLRHLTLQEGRDIYWSVPVEFQYYLVIPLVAAWLWLPLKAGWLAAALAAALALVLWRFPSAQAPLNSIELLYYLPIFFAGSAVAWVVGANVEPPQRPRGAGLADVLVAAVLVLSVPTVFVRIDPSADIDALHRAFVGWGVFWGAVVWALCAGWLPWLSALLRWRGLRACGRWCFGIYLLHMPALHLAKRLPLPLPLQGWVGLAIAVAVAAAAYAWLERPAMRFATRWAPSGRQDRPRPAA